MNPYREPASGPTVDEVKEAEAKAAERGVLAQLADVANGIADAAIANAKAKARAGELMRFPRVPLISTQLVEGLFREMLCGDGLEVAVIISELYDGYTVRIRSVRTRRSLLTEIVDSHVLSLAYADTAAFVNAMHRIIERAKEAHFTEMFEETPCRRS